MTASGSVIFGEVLNKDQVADKKTGDVAASTTLAIGLVYQDGSNGWKVAPVDGSVPARRLFWNPKSIDNSSGSKGDKTGVFYGQNALVVGQADQAIVVDTACRASQNASHGGQFESLGDVADAALNAIFSDTEAEAEIDLVRDYNEDKIALYKGHIGELVETGNDPTDAVDEDQNGVYHIVRN